MSVIKTKDLVKVYTDIAVPVHALNDVDLEIKEGEFTAIVGPSGCGKTTLLNMIGGLDTPTSGHVEINGVDISTLSDSKLIEFRQKNIGFVFQSYNLIPVLTAKENIEFIMLLQKKSKAERDARVKELLEEVDMIDKIDVKPVDLSGGQQQRVSVARALASKPKFILADEPTANLDSVTTSNLLDLMSKLNVEEKMTFIFSTHDQRVIDKAHRVITLIDGKIESDVNQTPS
ncbi:MAG: ABC transporter ATP-binding protein [Bacteroidia bacterium]|nr:ABC transporter ATP-binding protein [Bacteroidia bacterium]NNC85215.1 ABC transporter ATP-binding protein [Bacteroidia bacterium]NNM15163.1 ABC transporter ATP-binding protein [Bacteroidia bacterium]